MAATSTRSSSTQSSNARGEILASIRRSLSASSPFDAIHDKHRGHLADSPVLQSQAPGVASGDGLIDNFRESLKSVGGNFMLAANETEAADLVESIIENLGAKRIAVSDSELVDRLVKSSTGHEFIENSPAAVLFDCDLGITSAQWAIAETGTLVLESDVESHRLTSLVPPVHICVVEADSIRRTLGEILDLTARKLSRTITFITGASRTSDIELTLVIGVHGPGELYVIVIAD